MVTRDALEATKDSCQRMILQSKKAPALIAGSAYLLWLYTDAPGAGQLGRTWLQTRIDKSNVDIDAHNKQEEKLRQRVRARAAGTLKKNDLIFRRGANESQKKAVRDEKQMLTMLARLDDKQWSARKLDRIEARNNTPPYTRILKFLFRTDAQPHVVSRYATVLGWLHDEFAGKKLDDAADAAAAIALVGGFEAVLHAQRNKSKAPTSSVAATQAVTVIHAEGSEQSLLGADEATVAPPVIADVPGPTGDQAKPSIAATGAGSDTSKSSAALRTADGDSASAEKAAVGQLTRNSLTVNLTFEPPLFELPPGRIEIVADYNNRQLHVRAVKVVQVPSGQLLGGARRAVKRTLGRGRGASRKVGAAMTKSKRPRKTSKKAIF